MLQMLLLFSYVWCKSRLVKSFCKDLDIFFVSVYSIYVYDGIYTQFPPR